MRAEAADCARSHVSTVVTSTAPRKGPSAVPRPPMIAASEKRHERSIEKVHRIDEADVLRPERAAHRGEGGAHGDRTTLSRRSATPSESARSSSSRTAASW